MGTETDLPGMMALENAVEKGEWPHTMDAQVWAKEWISRFSVDQSIALDEGAMIGWFANAIMAGYDAACMRGR